MAAPAAPNHVHVEPRHFAVHERDARLAGAATVLEVKIARAKLRPGGVSETGHRSQCQEGGQQNDGKTEALHHGCDLSVLRLSTKRMAIGRPATACAMPSLKCNGVQRASAALTASR